jgi:hypothetical protein
MKKMTLTIIGTVMMLGACGGGGSTGNTMVDPDPTPTVGAVTENANGTFTVVDEGETFELSTNTVTTNGRLSWISSDERGSSFITDDVTAIGGLIDREPFSGITGTLSDAPSGNAEFVGRYAIAGFSTFNSGVLDLEYDLTANTLDSADGSDFVVDGDVGTDGAITGTIAYAGETSDFDGGFYGTNSVAGAFDNDTIGGVFFGTN